MRTCATAFGLLAASAFLAACGSSSSDPKVVSSPSVITPSATLPTPTPSPTATVLTAGQSWAWSNDSGASGTTTVLGYEQPVLQSDPPGTELGVPSGSQWGRLDIKVCETAGPSIGVSQEPWHLQFADGSQADVTGLNGGDFPKPELPPDGTVQPGSCARGGIMFPIPKGQRPRQAVYSPESNPEPVYWVIVKK
jgi:hypothetical protein